MPRLPDSECNLMFIDFETGGLDPMIHDITQAAYVLTDKTGTIVLDEYCDKVIPKRPVDPKAAEINGYNAEKWAAEGVDLSVAMHRITRASRDAIFIAHNQSFDWSFFQAAQRRYLDSRNRTQFPWNGSYHKMCTMTMGMPMVRAGLLENAKLQTFAAYFGIDPGEAHTALSDARTCWEIFKRLDPVYQQAMHALRKVA